MIFKPIKFKYMQQNTTNETQFETADIQVGDEILFRNADVVEHNLFWKVVYKIPNSRLAVEIREMGFAQKMMIETRDVVLLQKKK